MAFYLNGDRSPANLYDYDFATRKVTKLTNRLNPEINPVDLVDAEIIRYSSFDGMKIPAILFKPHQVHATPSPLTRPFVVFFNGFNRGFDKLASSYGNTTARLVRLSAIVLAVYAGLLGLTGLFVAAAQLSWRLVAAYVSLAGTLVAVETGLVTRTM